MKQYRLAVLNSHPIQYFAPLYRRLAQEAGVDLTVYYCSRQGLEGYADPGFGGQHVKWDIPLLEGYSAVFLDNLRGQSEVGGFWSLINSGIFRELRRNRFDALWVHGHNYFTYILAYLTARIYGIRIFTRGETHLLLRRSRYKELIRAPLMRLLYTQCDAFLAIGSRNAEYYRQHGVPADRIFRVPYTVDNRRFIQASELGRARRAELRGGLGLDGAIPLILYASKFTSRKRPLDLVQAKLALERQGIRCGLLMIGSGEQEAAIREFCATHQMQDVAFTGFVNQTELPAYYAAADVFVLPSENEPWGLIINEVMCAGLPVVVTEEVGAAPDLVLPGENGAVYPAGNVEALTEILRRLVVDQPLRQRMGEKSLSIISGWSYEQCVSGIRSALESTDPAPRQQCA